MKKVISAVLALAMMACMTAVFTFNADEGFALTTNVTKVDDSTINVASTVQMPVAKKMIGIQIAVVYDTSVLEPVYTDDYDHVNLDTGTKFDRWSPTVAYPGNSEWTDRVIFQAYDNGRNPWNTDEPVQVTTMNFKIKDGASITSESVLNVYMDDCTNFDNDVFADAFDGVTTTIFEEGIIPATKELQSIEVTGPAKTEYFVGDTFDASGLVVTAKYSTGENEDVTAQATYEAPDMTTAGDKTVTVTYEDKTATFTVSVVEDTVVDVTFTGPSITTYLKDDAFSSKGITATEVYASGKTADVTDRVSVSDVDLTTIGTKTVAVSFGDYSKSFDVIVSTKGDVNVDGRVSLADVILVAKAVLNDDADANSPAVVFGDVNDEVGLQLGDVTALAKIVIEA